eukprot:3810034-Pleurochrysis_carterae.AAC.2
MPSRCFSCDAAITSPEAVVKPESTEFERSAINTSNRKRAMSKWKAPTRRESERAAAMYSSL